jgi:hypothetical protein
MTGIAAGRGRGLKATRINTNLRLPADLVRQVEAWAAHNHRSFSQQVTHLLRLALEERRNRNGQEIDWSMVALPSSDVAMTQPRLYMPRDVHEAVWTWAEDEERPLSTQVALILQRALDRRTKTVTAA